MENVGGLVCGGVSLGASGLETLGHRPKLFVQCVDHKEIVGGGGTSGANEGEYLVQ